MKNRGLIKRALKQCAKCGWVDEKSKNSKTGYARTIGRDCVYFMEKMQMMLGYILLNNRSVIHKSLNK